MKHGSKDILIATNQLVNIGGSEIITLEFAEFFIQRGHSVIIFTNFIGNPMKKLIKERTGLSIKTEASKIYPLQYDFVYVQHQVAALFNYEHSDHDKEKTTFVFGRLSRRLFLESGGWLHDNILGNRTIANSLLTAKHLRQRNLRHPVSVFHNAAPSSFFSIPRILPEVPKNILVISNHADSSLLEAVDFLRKVATVTHIGRQGGIPRRVVGDDLHWADLVVSIGKSVQYALAACTPVFVYDHLGGPGYLDKNNFAKAALFSFTGRCCETKMTGKQIFDRIMSGYASARCFTNSLPNEIRQLYMLEPYLEELLRIPPTLNQERRQQLACQVEILRNERNIALQIRAETLKHYQSGGETKKLS